MSAFDSITIEGVAQGTASPQAGGSPFDSIRIVEAPKRAPEPPPGGVEGAVRNFVGGTADVVDLVFAGTPAMVLGTFAESVNRLQGAVSSKPRKQVAEEGAALSTSIGEAFGTPLRTTLTNLGYLRKDEPGAIQKGMGAVMELVERDAKAVEERTGGTVLKEDVLMLVNGLMAAAGVKGTGYGTRKILDARKAKAAALELDKLKGERAAENVAEATADAGKTATPVKDATNLGNIPIIESLTPEAQAAAKAQRKAMRKEMRARFADERYDPARPDSPQAEAARVRQQEDRMPAEGVRYEMPRGYGPDPSMDWLRGGAAVGVGLGALYALAEDNPEVAAAMTAGAFVAGRGKGLTLEALRTMPPATPLGRILDQSSYSLSSLEMLPKNRFEFGKESVRQLLKRDSVTKAERAILEPVLDSVPGETITAKQLMEGVKARTGDFELKRVESNSFADYGLDRIDREADLSQQIDAEPWIPEGTTPEAEAQMRATHAAARADAARRTAEPTTTIYQSPVELGAANHFGDPNYFAHTRSFVEDGVKHVVELQSDVAQKAGKVLTEGERASYHADLDRVETKLRELELAGGRSVPAIHSDMNGYLKTLGQRPFSPGHRPNGGVIETLYKTDQTFKALRDEFDAAVDRKAERDRLEVLAAEKRTELSADNSARMVQPMLKDWHKRLVREELAEAARAREVRLQHDAQLERDIAASKAEVVPPEHASNQADYVAHLERTRGIWMGERTPVPEPFVRFADADTVAKVEGWPTKENPEYKKARDKVWAAEDVVNAFLEKRDFGDEYLAAVAKEKELRKALEAAEKLPPAFSPEHQGIYDRYAKDVTKFLKQLGGKHVVDAQGHGWWEVPVEGSKATPAGRRVQQFGGLDADLAKAVAVIGGGAALGNYLADRENRLGGAIQGAIVGLAALAASRHPGFRDAAKAAGSAADYGLGLASTRVWNISESLHWRMVKHEGDVLKLSHDALAATEKFSNYLRKLPEAAKSQLNRDILSADFPAVLRQLGANPGMIAEWQKVRSTLLDLGNQLKDAGKLRELLTDYYPRVVVDPEGLLAALGKEKRTYIDAQLDKARAKAARTGQELSPLEISTIINRALKSQAQGTGRPGFLKKRSVQEITPELEPFYAPASESLPLYIRAVVREIERAKFFGENLVRDADTGVVDIDTSIGNLVNQERAKGKLTAAQEAELTSILRSRFGPGERGMNKYLQAAKNLSYAGLLGHVTSAIPQMADTAMAFYAHGFLPTVKAMQAVGKRAPDRVTVRDVGLADHVVEELTGGTAKPKTILGFQLSSAKFLQKAFKYSGFSLTDQFGKNVHLNAAWTKYRGWAQSAAGIERIRGKYGKALGPEFDSLVADLREGKLTDRTRTLLFAELSDMQPVSKLEVPQAYLDMPNGRVVYMLKTWMLKQADIVRRDIVQRAARGDKRGALEAGLRFSLILGMSGASVEAVKNLLLGREDPLELSDIPNNVLKTFALSEYTMDKVRQGKPLDAAMNVALPPYKMWDEILARDPKAVNYVPLVGRLVYADNMQDLGISTGFHGAAKANLRRENREKAREREVGNPEGVAERRRRAKERYEERLREIENR